MKWTPTLFLIAASVTALPSQAAEFSTGQAARLVIGQKPFTAQTPGASASLLGAVSGVAVANGILVVTDDNRLGALPRNNRVLIFRDFPQVLNDPYLEFPQSDERCPACIGEASTVLGQPDFATVEKVLGASAKQNNVQTPTGVAWNGRYLAIADTDNNRVLVWKGLPTTNQQNADFVVGQKDFTSNKGPRALTADSLRGPMGVWLDENDGLWVADTMNNRVLYYGVITQNGQSARFALGQPSLSVNNQRSIAEPPDVRADTMLNPTSVTSDGHRLYVADLGLSRILIWNSIPSRDGQAADVVVGQKDMTTYGPNRSSDLCEPDSTTEDGTKIYPRRCAATMSLPRYALSDGTRLYVADGGNDRVLVFNTIPGTNGVRADTIIGQQTEFLNQASDSAEPARVSSTDSFKTPHSLAWDGLNLYVADTFNRRVLVYTPGDFHMPLSAVRNAASPDVYAQGTITFGGEVVKDDEITITIAKLGDDESKKEYKTKVAEGTTLDDLVNEFVNQINAGDGNPLVQAFPNTVFNTVILGAREPGPTGNEITMAYTNSNTASTLVVSLSGSTLSGGQDAARVAPYGLVTIVGEGLADRTSEVRSLLEPLPFEIDGTQVYIDGKLAPLVFVSPTQIVAQLPVETTGSTSSSGIIRTRRNDGRITVSTPVAVRVIEHNPGVFTETIGIPSPGQAYHFSSAATGTISVDGLAKKGDKVTVIINSREYTYDVQSGDANGDGEVKTDEGETLIQIRDKLVELITNNDPEVEAFPSGFYSRVRLRARVPGPIGNGITLGVRSTDSGGADNSGVQLFTTNTVMCCANEAGALITEDNPAVPGETIVVLATGLGVLSGEDARNAMINGQPYNGPDLNDVVEFVSSLAGGKTANVLFSGLRKGTVGVYEVHLELNADLPTNPKTNVTIAQSFQVSNIFTIPLVNPNPDAEQ